MYESSSDTSSITPVESTTHFLTPENFQRLRTLQNELFKQVDMAPSVKKLTNLLITDHNLEQLKKDFIQRYPLSH